MLIRSLLLAGMAWAPSAARAQAVALGKANIGDHVDPTSLIGLPCERKGLGASMRCVVQEDAPNRTVMTAILSPDPTQELYLTGVEFTSVSKPGQFDTQSAPVAMRGVRQTFVDGMVANGYRIERVDAADKIHLGGPRHVVCFGSTVVGQPPSLLSSGTPTTFKVVCEMVVAPVGYESGNVTACRTYIEAQNALPCMSIAQLSVTDMCPATLDSSPVNMGGYYRCLAENAKCNGSIPELQGQVSCVMPAL